MNNTDINNTEQNETNPLDKYEGNIDAFGTEYIPQTKNELKNRFNKLFDELFDRG